MRRENLAKIGVSVQARELALFHGLGILLLSLDAGALYRSIERCYTASRKAYSQAEERSDMLNGTHIIRISRHKLLLRI